MTHEQEVLFEKNKNLIYTAINTYIKCPGMYGLNDYDDLVQIGSMGLCKAIEGYNYSKGKFSTYAIPIIRNTLYNAIRDCAYRQDVISLNEEWIDIDEDLAQESAQSIADEIIFKDGIEFLGDCAKRYKGIAGKGAMAIKLSLLGYDCGEIAQMYGVESKTVTAWISRARKKLQREPELLKILNMA